MTPAESAISSPQLSERPELRDCAGRISDHTRFLHEDAPEVSW